MSAGGMLQAAIVAALQGHAPLYELTVFDAPPVRGGLPYAVVGEPVLADWSAVEVAGREGRVAVTLHDAGERPLRLRAMLGEVEEQLPALAAAVGEGWHVAQLRLARSRMVRGRDEDWAATAEFTVRMWRENG